MSGALDFSTPDLIASFNCGPIDGVRPVKAKGADGTWRESSTAPLSYDPCAVHPAPKGETLNQASPDSDRQKDRIRLYCCAEIRNADRVTWDSRNWRVIHVETYGTQAGVWLAEAALLDVVATPP